MELWKHTIPSLSQRSSSVINGERSRQPVHEKRVSLSNRMRGIDCMLADIEAQIEMLRRERTYLRLVREELVGMETERNGSSLRNTSLKEGALVFGWKQQDQLT